MHNKIRYDFSADVWKHEANGGWFFVSMPKELAEEIRSNLKWQEEGWGRMKASAQIKGIDWDTAIWYDKKRMTYLLPLKDDIRKKTRLEINDLVEVSVFI